MMVRPGGGGRGGILGAMAQYKVPQDVEADDKLIGPFSFRQFIYLGVVALAIALGWGLSRLFVPLAIIPLPIVLFFGALALPLRKDQPMEIYLAAVLSFFLKPRKRTWQPDGVQSLIEITAPKTVEVRRAKDLSQLEAEQRLSYLANIVDTEGWAVRGVAGMPQVTTPMQNDAFYAAQQAEDVLDEQGGVAQTFNSMIDQADSRRRQEMMQRMRQPESTQAVSTTPTTPDPYAQLTQPADTPAVADPQLTFNPYPSSIHQSVIQPLSAQPATKAPTPAVAPNVSPQPEPPTTSEPAVSPDIINLANNTDLSIETIAHEANRIQQKAETKLPDDDEVVISLR